MSGRHGGQPDEGSIGEPGEGLKAHVAPGDRPFVVRLEHEGTDQSNGDGLHNLAIFAWTVAIERERLRPRYREGFGRTPLNLRWQPDLRGPSGGADGPAEQAHSFDDQGVVRDDASQRPMPDRGLRPPRTQSTPTHSSASGVGARRRRRADYAEE